MRSPPFIYALLFLGLGSMTWLDSGQDKAALRGKRIYFQGTSDNATPITAALGEDPNRVPGSAFPCANCHGRNGQGKAEGGAVPADIRWSTLTKPYEQVLPSGRKHSPYTERLVKRAITLGFDSSNNTLSAAMPHYQMSQADLNDLLAYLKILGSEADPGVSDDQLRIGVILPPRRRTQMHDAVESILKAYFDEVNRQGGIFGRRLEMRSLDYPDASEARRAKVLDFLSSENVFALTSSFMAGDEAALAPVFQESETPVVGGFALYPQTSLPINPYVFYLDEGISGQIRALAEFAQKRFSTSGGRPAIIYSEVASSRQLADEVERSCKLLKIPPPVRVMISGENGAGSVVLQRIAEARGSFVFWLLPYSFLGPVLQKAGESARETGFLIPGSLVQNDMRILSASMNGRVFIASPVVQRGLSEEAAAEYRKLAGPNAPSNEIAPEQWVALASARTLVEALKRTGRDLSRETFIATLEHFANFDSGFAPPLSYGPNQRTGNTTMQILSLRNGTVAVEKEN